MALSIAFSIPNLLLNRARYIPPSMEVPLLLNHFNETPCKAVGIGGPCPSQIFFESLTYPNEGVGADYAYQISTRPHPHFQAFLRLWLYSKNKRHISKYSVEQYRTQQSKD
jgi:hypothetical protein